jgi:AcrR family transcriptional regulator
MSEILDLINIDRRRRAEIGRERRARNRARILEAARTLFTSERIASLTVDDVMRQARLSRGAFYSHFRSLDELWATVALDVAPAVRRLGQTGVVAADPVTRIAAGCAAFIGEAQRDPDWGALFARGVSAFPIVANAARERLTASLRRAEGEGRMTPFHWKSGLTLSSAQFSRPCARRATRAWRHATCPTLSAEFCARSASRRAKSSWRCVSSTKKRLRSVTRLRSQSPTDPEGIFYNGDKSGSF